MLNKNKSGIINQNLELRLDIIADLTGKKTDKAFIPSFNEQNKAAQNVRRLQAYKTSKNIFLSPDKPLVQVGVNALNDGKTVIMPTGGLRNGFFALHRSFIAMPKACVAVSSPGIAKFGRPAITKKTSRLDIDLVITGLVGVDQNGNRLGDGTGFFDLEYAILHELSCIRNGIPVVGICHTEQIVDEVVSSPWDVPLDTIVTQDGSRSFAKKDKKNAILWEHLSEKTVKNITLLYQLQGR